MFKQRKALFEHPNFLSGIWVNVRLGANLTFTHHEGLHIGWDGCQQGPDTNLPLFELRPEGS